MSIKNKNLLICLTPLQMMIASKIIDENPAIYDILCVSYNDNEKYNYYFSKISVKCKKNYRFLIKSENKLGRLYDLICMKYFVKKNIRNEYNGVFVASIDNPFIHVILSFISKKELYTFDDGTANINKDSIYYNPVVKPFIQNIFIKFIGCIYSLDRIKMESQFHYTLYNGFENVIKNTKILNLLKINDNVVGVNKISIFLGQPLADIKYVSTEQVISFMENYKIKKYFPHPRETEKFENLDYIDSKLIFEEYVQKLILSGYVVDVYTLLSTAVLNVEHKNLNVYVVVFPEMENNYLEIYNLFNKKGFTFLKNGCF